MNRVGCELGLGGFFAALVWVGAITDPRYSFVRHTLSELAGQGMPYAWGMRLGFVCLALAAAATAWHLRSWTWVFPPLVLFVLAMFGVAVWSSGAPCADIPYDATEDRVHSLMANIVGTAFCVTCLADALARRGLLPWLSWLGAVASVALPLFMLAFPDVAGVFQRLMFAIAAYWLWRRSFSVQLPRYVE